MNVLEAMINNLLQYGETTTTLVLSSTVNRRVIEHGPEEPLDLTRQCRETNSAP